MKKVRVKDCFLYKIEEQSYGLIQVIAKSKAGYWVRVFYELVEDDCDRIDAIIQSSQFYYVKNFSEYELIHKSDQYIGKYEVPLFVDIPEFTRASERQLNGKLYWYIFDEQKGKVIEQFNHFNEKLKELSPEQSWGIEYIKRRWKERFTLERWNDEMENQWYYHYLIRYEPEKLKKLRLSDAELKANKPSKLWNVSVEELNDILKIEQCLEDFIDHVNGENAERAVKQMIADLNKINENHFIIDTGRAEEILSYIVFIMMSKNIEFDETVMDAERNW